MVKSFDLGADSVKMSTAASEALERKRSQVIDAFLAQHENPEDYQLTTGERDRLAKFIETERSIKAMADADERFEQESVFGLTVTDWESGNDLTFGQSDLEKDENGIAGAEYIRALTKRRRGKAVKEAGLLG